MKEPQGYVFEGRVTEIVLDNKRMTVLACSDGKTFFSMEEVFRGARGKLVTVQVLEMEETIVPSGVSASSGHVVLGGGPVLIQ